MGDEDDGASRLGNDDATVDERASVLVSHAGTRPRAAVATPDPAHTRRGARSLARARPPQRTVPERRVMATTRASAVCSRVHMVRTYTWPRTETNQRANQSTCVFSE
jgi:hypothetical protein